MPCSPLDLLQSVLGTLEVGDSPLNAVSQVLNTDKKNPKQTNKTKTPHVSQPAGYTLANTSQYAAGLLPYKSTPLTHVQLLVYKDMVYFLHRCFLLS